MESCRSAPTCHPSHPNLIPSTSQLNLRPSDPLARSPLGTPLSTSPERPCPAAWSIATGIIPAIFTRVPLCGYFVEIMAILKFVFIFVEVLLLFNLLIFVHELGHFLAARWRGLKIDRFAIWFGKPIWKTKINGVEYALGTIP